MRPPMNDRNRRESTETSNIGSTSPSIVRNSNSNTNSTGEVSSGSSSVSEGAAPSPLYRPIIFQYKCRGGLFLEDSESQQQQQQQQHGVVVLPKSLSTPSCVGLESRLKKLQELPLMTKEESLRAFLWHTHHPMSTTTTSYESTSTHHHNRTSTSTSTSQEDEEGGPNYYPQKRDGEGAFSTMAFYGTTDVSVLMLRDAKKAEVVAVAPDCKLGLTIREAGDNSGGESLSTLRLGPVEVTVGNQYEYQPQQPATNTQSSQQQQQQQGDNPSKHSHPSNTPLHNPTNTSHTLNAKDTKQTQSSSTTEEDYFKKVVYALSKTAESMQNNAKLIKDELRDDFPSRVFHASDKIVNNFGRTMDRTKKVILDVYKMWSDDDPKS